MRSHAARGCGLCKIRILPVQLTGWKATPHRCTQEEVDAALAVAGQATTRRVASLAALAAPSGVCGPSGREASFGKVGFTDQRRRTLVRFRTAGRVRRRDLRAGQHHHARAGPLVSGPTATSQARDEGRDCSRFSPAMIVRACHPFRPLAAFAPRLARKTARLRPLSPPPPPPPCKLNPVSHRAAIMLCLA